MMAEDDWVRAAMMDDAAAVELLLRLKQSQATTTVKSEVSLVVPLPKWGVQQPRSRLRCDAAVLQRKEADSTRCSPTTPLSWSSGSAGVSPSATGDGFDESILPSNIYPADGRSKGFVAAETTSSTKRSRKKKTYAGLKEEESLLLKEKIYLKEEIAVLCATVKEQRTRNESLKRMKLDLDLRSTRNRIATSFDEEKVTLNQLNQTPTLPTTHAACDDLVSSSYLCQAPKAVSKRDSFYVLPDLNMMPTEEDSSF